ncbi:MAG: hypothetical protein WDZ49_13180 [Litorilinea sp.]
MLLGLHAQAQAQAGCTGVACVSAGTTVAELDSTQSPLLNALLESLTGGEVTLSAVEYNTLLGADIELGALLDQLQADLSLGTPTEVLESDITLGQLLNAAAAVSNDAQVDAVLNDLAATLDLTSTILLGDLLQIEIGPESFADIDLNLFELIIGSAQLFNSANLVGTPAGVVISGSELGLGDAIGDIVLRATVIEAPAIVCGPAGSSFNSAAIRVALNVNLLDVESNDTIGLGALLNLLNVSVTATLVDLDIYLEIGRGEGILQSIDAVTGAVDVEATPGLVNLYVGQIADAVFFDREATISAEDVEQGVIGTVALQALGLGTSLIDIKARAVASGADPEPTVLNFTGPYPQTLSTAVGAGALDNLLIALLENLELEISLLGGFLNLDGLLAFVVELVEDLIDDVVSPLLNSLLVDAVDPVLDGLGLAIGKMTVTVLGTENLCPSLTVTKSHAGNFLAGGTGTYNIVVHNDGDGPTSGAITVVDTLPADLTYASFPGSGWTFEGQSGQEVTFSHAGPLAAGATLPTLRLVVDVDEEASGTVTNQVSVDTPGNDDTGNSDDDDETTIVAVPPEDACAEEGICPALTVEKTHQGDFTAGEEGIYSIIVRNDGANVTTGTIVVTDTLPAGITFGSFGGTGWSLVTNNDPVIVFSHNLPIEPGETLPLLALTVDVDAEASGTVVNNVVVDSDGNVGGDDSNTEDPTTIIPPPTCPDLPNCPELRVEKNHTEDFVAGEQGQYTILVHNDGAAAATQIVVTDTLPTGMTLADFSGSGWTQQDQIGRMSIFTHPGPLAPAGILAPLVLTVDVAESAEGTLINQVRVDAPGNVPDDSQEGEDPTTVIPPPTCPDLDECPSLTVAKSHTGNFVAGGQGVYTIRVSNVGTAATSSSIIVSDTLPTGMTYAAHSGSGWVHLSNAGQTQRFVHSGPVAPGASLPDLLLTVDVGSDSAGTHVNSVSVSTQGNVPHDDALDEDSTQVVEGTGSDQCASDDICPALSIGKSHSGNFVAGGQGVYAIEVNNSGSAATTGAITVIDTLPVGMSYAGHTGLGWQLSEENGQTLSFTHAGPVAPGASLPTLYLTVDISNEASGTVVNSVTAETPDNLNEGDSDDEDSTTIVPSGDATTLCQQEQVCPALRLEKTAVGDFMAGDVGQYRFTVQNIGVASTYGAIHITDTLPSGMTYQSHAGEGWTVASQNGQTVALTHPGPLAPGESLPVLTINVNIDEGMEGEKVNSAVVSTPGNIGGTEVDVETVDVVPNSSCPAEGACPSLVVEKRHAGNFRAGAVGVYSITVRNTGTGATQGAISVEDTLPEGMSYATHSGSGWTLEGQEGRTLFFTHDGPLAADSELPVLRLTVLVSRKATGTLVNQVAADTPGNVANEGQSGEDATVIDALGRFYVPAIEKAMPIE